MVHACISSIIYHHPMSTVLHLLSPDKKENSVSQSSLVKPHSSSFPSSSAPTTITKTAVLNSRSQNPSSSSSSQSSSPVASSHGLRSQNGTIPSKRLSTVIEPSPARSPGISPSSSTTSLTTVFNRLRNRASRILMMSDGIAGEKVGGDTSSSSSSWSSAAHYTTGSDVATITKTDSIIIDDATIVDGDDDGEEDNMMTLSSITEEQWKKIINFLFFPFFKNYVSFFNSTQFILDLYEEWKDIQEDDELVISNNQQQRLIQRQETKRTVLSSFVISSETCHKECVTTTQEAEQEEADQSGEVKDHINELIKEKRNQLYLKLQVFLSFSTSSDMETKTIKDVFHFFQREIDHLNHDLAIRWTTIFSSCRKIMKQIKSILYKNYLNEIIAFWKQQMIIHTRRLFYCFLLV
jgi:hypothetical protein